MFQFCVLHGEKKSGVFGTNQVNADYISFAYSRKTLLDLETQLYFSIIFEKKWLNQVNINLIYSCNYIAQSSNYFYIV